jgi:hypothetical protein
MIEEKKDGPALNTIYEEFDLSDRIKSLKGKHIKIKKIVKKEDGNYSIRETSLFGDKSLDPGPAPDLHPATQSSLKDLQATYANVLPADVNFQRPAGASSTGLDWPAKKESRPFGPTGLDLGGLGSSRREPVMPLSTTYTPKQSLFQSGHARDWPADLHASG